MLVLKAGLRALRLSPKLSYNFAKKRSGKDDDDVAG